MKYAGVELKASAQRYRSIKPYVFVGSIIKGQASSLWQIFLSLATASPSDPSVMIVESFDRWCLHCLARCKSGIRQFRNTTDRGLESSPPIRCGRNPNEINANIHYEGDDDNGNHFFTEATFCHKCFDLRIAIVADREEKWA